MNFSTDYGCELYEGDADAIGAAINASDWAALRGGGAAHGFVGFPHFIHSDYFGDLSGAVAAVLQQPEVRIDSLRTVAGEDGHWGAEVLPMDWVAAVAAVPAGSIWLLQQNWRESCFRSYGEPEAWLEGELLDPLYRFTLLCGAALSRQTDVVLLAV